MNGLTHSAWVAHNSDVCIMARATAAVGVFRRGDIDCPDCLAELDLRDQRAAEGKGLNDAFVIPAFTPAARFVRVDDRILVDPREIAAVLGTRDETRVVLHGGAARDMHLVTTRPLAEVVALLEEWDS